MNGVRLETAEEEKDLGVWVNTSLKPLKQREMAAKMANFPLVLQQRALHYLKKD